MPIGDRRRFCIDNALILIFDDGEAPARADAICFLAPEDMHYAYIHGAQEGARISWHTYGTPFRGEEATGRHRGILKQGRD